MKYVSTLWICIFLLIGGCNSGGGIGGDADDQASLVRLLLYSNEWDVEAIIADRSAEAFDRDPARNHKALPASCRDGQLSALAPPDNRFCDLN